MSSSIILKGLGESNEMIQLQVYDMRGKMVKSFWETPLHSTWNCFSLSPKHTITTATLTNLGNCFNFLKLHDMTPCMAQGELEKCSDVAVVRIVRSTTALKGFFLQKKIPFSHCDNEKKSSWKECFNTWKDPGLMTTVLSHF